MSDNFLVITAKKCGIINESILVIPATAIGKEPPILESILTTGILIEMNKMSKIK